MFVSPPPPTSTKQALPNLLGKRKGHELYTVPEEPSSASLVSSPHLAQKEFVNAPPEFAHRARDEIRKRLLSRKGDSYPSDDQRSVSSGMTHSSFHSDAQSVATSGVSSVFSSHPSIATQSSAATTFIEDDKPRVITLQEALPKVFYDMYTPEILMNPQNLLCNGRPKFTKRELLDWDLNDIRSLLIVEKMRPEWGTYLPQVVFDSAITATDSKGPQCVPEFRIQLLPLNSPDEFIIRTLVESDLYLEAHLDYDFKLTNAKYTVAAARKRHEQLTGLNEPVMHLSKPEWRNIIENYLLNIAVEAQCRFDFKKRCSDYKKWKQEQMEIKRPDMPPPSIIPSRKRENSLLKRTLLKNTAMKLAEERPCVPPKVSITKEEKASLWSQCQAQVYQRLGLNWTPDGM